jgi:hypothetical protein
MAELATTLLEDIESNFNEISNKIQSYRSQLELSLSEFESDKYLENLIKSQRSLKRLSNELDKSLDDLIDKYY